MNRRSLAALALGVVSLACATVEQTFSQEYYTVGDSGPAAIRGVVQDKISGGRLDGAFVLLRCDCLGGERETRTDADGKYVFRGLPPGRYTVQFLYSTTNVQVEGELRPGYRWRLDARLLSNHRY